MTPLIHSDAEQEDEQNDGSGSGDESGEASGSVDAEAKSSNSLPSTGRASTNQGTGRIAREGLGMPRPPSTKPVVERPTISGVMIKVCFANASFSCQILIPNANKKEKDASSPALPLSFSLPSPLPPSLPSSIAFLFPIFSLHLHRSEPHSHPESACSTLASDL